MAWTNSKIFRAYIADVLDSTTAMDLGADTPKVSLHNNSVTPSQDVASASSAFNTGVWTTGNQVTDATNWVSGGRPLVSAALNSATAGVVYYDADDTAGAGACTMSNIYGCLVYDDTITTPVADQGLCFNYFGGAQSVTAGVFTVIWHANGIFRLNL
jgi:hypothetical protein